MATGFEALVGYLYLIGNKERLDFIFSREYEIMNELEITKERKLQCEVNPKDFNSKGEFVEM